HGALWGCPHLSSLWEPPEQDGGPGERDGGEGPPEVKRSQPLFIHGSRWEEPRASSLPSIPNPFPELCSPSNSPILSSPALGQAPPREGTSHVVKVFGEDGACRSLEASAATTARQLCETLVRRTRALHDHSWALVELHQHLALGERPWGHSRAWSTGLQTLLMSLCPSQSAAWRTTSRWWRCRAPGPRVPTAASCSARTSPSTSSSRATR
uniref:Ras-associating domain-containing protein n=1 Tax=Catharus ustulatus TaxID=91951 RepID=A0A8C3UKK3_CATUS